MKQIKMLVATLIMLVGATSFVNAQVKIAHINVQQLVADMPETKTAQAELEKLQQTLRADLEGSEKEIQSKVQQYKQEAPQKTNDENLKRQRELEQLEVSINQARQVAQQEYQKKQQELLTPILKRIETTIQQVGRELGYQYVLDSSPGATNLILAEGKDIMAEVKQKLGF